MRRGGEGLFTPGTVAQEEKGRSFSRFVPALVLVWLFALWEVQTELISVRVTGAWLT